MIVMNSSVYFVETNKAHITGRLFVKLSNDTIFYFGSDVEMTSKESYLNEIFLKRLVDNKQNVWRGLTVEEQGSNIYIVESLYSGGLNRSKPAVQYKYLLSDLVKCTQEWPKSDNSYWGEYNALANKHVVLPSFPDIAITCTPK